MAITFNPAATYTIFKEANFNDENSIIHLDSNKNLKSDSTFSSANIFRWMRGSASRQHNNEIRTQLLKSLGESFGISGMKTGKNGEITFSKDFMDKLERFLGPAFKREDFGISDQGGAVTSGKPLTSRRLKAICAQANLYDTNNFNLTEYKHKLTTILKNEFNIDTTLNLTPEQLNNLAGGRMPLKVFAGIEKCLDFLINDFDSFLKYSNEFSLAKELEETEGFKGVKFEVKNPKTGEYEDLADGNCSTFLFETLKGNLLHIERANFEKDVDTDLTPLKNYIKNQLTSFIKNGVDAYFESKLNGKIGDLMETLESPGACTEEKAMRLHDFRAAHFQAKVDTKLEAELNTIINNTNDTPLNKVIESEIEAIEKTHPEFKTWNQFSAELKKRLLTMRRPMVEMQENQGKITFVPLKDSKGYTVVRPIEPKDIDTIGQKIYTMIYGEDE